MTARIGAAARSAAVTVSGSAQLSINIFFGDCISIMRLPFGLALGLLLIFSDRIATVLSSIVEESISLGLDDNMQMQCGLYNSGVAGPDLLSASGHSKQHHNINRFE
jgi:hypothetical protein